MGTSKSHSGPVSSSPLIPDWLEEDEDSDLVDQSNENAHDTDTEEVAAEPEKDKPIEEALGGQKSSDSDPKTQDTSNSQKSFRSTSAALGKYTREGNQKFLRRALKNYSSKAYGSKKGLQRRLSYVPADLQRISGTLLNVASADSRIREALSSNDSNEIASALSELLESDKRGLESASTRDSLHKATEYLLSTFDELDMSALTQEQVFLFSEKYTAHEAYQLFMLDAGLIIEKHYKELSAYNEVSKDIRDYISQNVSTVYTNIRKSGLSIANFTKNQFSKIIAQTLQIFIDASDS